MLILLLFNLFVQKVSVKVILGIGNDFFASASNIMETQQKTKTHIKALI